MTGAERVLLLDYPVVLGASVSEHVNDWMREFRLMALGQQTGVVAQDVPDRLAEMVQHLSRHYATELSEPDRLRSAALARGDATVDLPYPVRPETEATVVGWKAVLADVDHYCAAEDLLTLQRTPEQVALSDWVCEEFVRQLAGQPPRPWSEVAEGRVSAARAARSA